MPLYGSQMGHIEVLLCQWVNCKGGRLECVYGEIRGYRMEMSLDTQSNQLTQIKFFHNRPIFGKVGDIIHSVQYHPPPPPMCINEHFQQSVYYYTSVHYTLIN